MTSQNLLRRPEETGKAVPEGSYRGRIGTAVTKEVESRFADTGKRDILELKVSIRTQSGEVVTLYHQVTLSWSTKGKMLPLLEKLDVLPAPGESLDIGSLVGIPVQVIVENVKKGENTYSNIVSIKRVEGETTSIEETPLKKEVHNFIDIEDIFEI